MPEPSLARKSAPITPVDPEDHALLLAAADAALGWLDAFDRHAPKGFAFGGEQRVRRQLRQAIRRCA